MESPPIKSTEGFNEELAHGDDERGKIFVGGLSWDTSHDTLLKYFSRYGEVIDCVVMKNQATGKSRGFGFIKYRDSNCVEAVLDAGPHILDGREVDPKPCNPRALNKGGKSNENRARKVFVGGLPTDCNEMKLREAFGKYGNVLEVVIMMDQQKQRSRGFGFITFDTEQEVDNLCSQHFIQLDDKKVEVKRAEPRDGKGAPLTFNHGLTMMGIPGTGLIPSMGGLSPAAFTTGVPFPGTAAYGHATMPGTVMQALPPGLSTPAPAWLPAGPQTMPLGLPGNGLVLTHPGGTAGDIAAMGANILPNPVPSYLDLAQFNAGQTGAMLNSLYTSQVPAISSHTGAELKGQQPTSMAGLLGSYSQDTSNYGPSRGLIQDGAVVNSTTATSLCTQSPYTSYSAAIAPLGAYTSDLQGGYLTAAGGISVGYTATQPTNESIAAATRVAIPQGFHPYRR